VALNRRIGGKVVDEHDWQRKQMCAAFEAQLEVRLNRAGRTKVHGIIPQHYFSAASSECREMFISGHFYGCISLAQAVAEGLSRFVARAHSMNSGKDFLKRVAKLEKGKLISAESYAAFKRIWGNDRNTFHHLNESIEINYQTLEARAEECVNALYKIESEIFCYDLTNAGISPKHSEYWPKSSPDTVQVFLRLEC
jgi:hypothetical protein